MLALVGKEVGLDVGVREAIAVGSCQSSGSADVDHQLTLLVEHPESDLPADVIVSLDPAVLAVEAPSTAKTVPVPEQLWEGQDAELTLIVM